uniref:Ribosomal protein S16 n=1 Tax=Anotrichium furcellatum TaxID=41999 RepID=A0A4D6WL62_9FLOR|nr:ribosomal protein S16 [Anotrichium furcellatum]
MLKIRLKRLGRKKHACYRIIIIDSRKKRDGRAIEEVGFYHPIHKNAKINITQIQSRIKTGAQATSIVNKIMNKIQNIGE